MQKFKTLLEFAQTFQIPESSERLSIFISDDAGHGGLWDCRVVVSALGSSVELNGKQSSNRGQYRYLDNAGTGSHFNYQSLWEGD